MTSAAAAPKLPGAPPPVPNSILKNPSFGKPKVSLGFQQLNTDFHLPEDFTLIKKLGKGAYGKVMQIMHKPTQREYACKRFEMVFSDKQRSRRLLREVDILSKMMHPCTNRLLCIIPPNNIEGSPDKEIEDIDFNEVYLLLRLCDMDLKKLLKSAKHLEETQVKSIIYDILCGLKYLHAAKVIHRDLKPGNILVNDDCTIQICDFGLARSMKGVEPPVVSTSTSTSRETGVEECASPTKLSVPGMMGKAKSTKITPMSRREKEEMPMSPKANLRKEAINHTRPQLNHKSSIAGLSTINETLESIDGASNFSKSKQDISSSRGSKNKEEDIALMTGSAEYVADEDEESGAQSMKNVHGKEEESLKFDIAAVAMPHRLSQRKPKKDDDDDMNIGDAQNSIDA